MKQWYFWISVGGLVLGILLRTIALHSWMIPGSLVLTIGTVAVFGAVLLSLSRLYYRRVTRFIVVSLVCVTAISMGILVSDSRVQSIYTGFFEGYYEQEVFVEVRVSSEPKVRPNSVQTIMTVQKIATLDEVQEGVFRSVQNRSKEKIRVGLPAHTEASFGDIFLIKGRINRPNDFITDTGREFSYELFLAKDDVRATLSFPKSVELIEEGNRSVHRTLLGFKKKLISSMRRFLVEPHASLLAGILLGDTTGLGDDLEDAFRIAGLIHIVVLSGYNVTLVSDAVVRTFSSLVGRRIGLLFGIIGIMLFVLMVGAGPTVLRAGVMSVLVIISRLGHRAYMVERGLVIAGVIMILINPMILLYDLSFQLSFIATLGLIYGAPLLERYFAWLPSSLGIRTNTVATISTQIAVLPLLLYAIGQLSFVSIPVNALVLFVVAPAMFFGFVMSLFGLFLTPLALVFMLPTYILLSILIWAAVGAAGLPLSSMIVPEFPLWIMLLMYVVLIYFVFRATKKLRQRAQFE